MDAPHPGDPPQLVALPFPPTEPRVHPSPKPLSAACLAASATTLVDGRGYHPEMRLLMLSIWVGRPSRTVAGVAGAPRLGNPLPRLVAPRAGGRRRPGGPRPALTLSLGHACRPLHADRAGSLSWRKWRRPPRMRFRFSKTYFVAASERNAFSFSKNVLSVACGQ